MNDKTELPKAASDVIYERERQKQVEGWSEALDDRYTNNELARAAAVYCLTHSNGENQAVDWPWDLNTFKPKDTRSNLVRAGALIQAAIEQHDRKIKTQEKGNVQ